MTRFRVAMCIATILWLAGCGEKTPVSGDVPRVTAVPADPKLAKLYEQTCKACHTNPGSGAPQAGDAPAWTPRLAQGMPKLLDHTVNGYKGMPPLGTCMDCGEPEFTALIRFMAQGK